MIYKVWSTIAPERQYVAAFILDGEHSLLMDDWFGIVRPFFVNGSAAKAQVRLAPLLASPYFVIEGENAAVQIPDQDMGVVHPVPTPESIATFKDGHGNHTKLETFGSATFVNGAPATSDDLAKIKEQVSSGLLELVTS